MVLPVVESIVNPDGKLAETESPVREEDASVLAIVTVKTELAPEAMGLVP